MRPTEVFFDSNVLIYLFSSDDAKADRAELLLAEGGTVSIQVLNEVSSIARRKAKLGFSALRDILGIIRTTCAVKTLDLETHELGLDIAERYLFSVHDGMIVAAALRAGCRILYSEDFQRDQSIGGSLVIRNPFREVPAPLP